MDYIHVEYSYPIKFLWRLWQSVCLRRRKVKISPLARFNKHSKLDGYNVVHSHANVGNSHVGRYTYIQEDSYLPNCEIGRFCSIACGVKLICFRHPTDTFVSTSPVFFSTAEQCGKSFVKEALFEEQKLIDGRSAIIGNDVWMGTEARIIEGVKIGNGAIVLAGALVTKDVPTYAIVGGVPAKIIRYRFTEEQIAALEESAWWNESDEWLESNAAAFTDIEKFIKLKQQ